MIRFSIILLIITTVGCAQTEKIIESGNSKLHYKTFGKGKPILIINGGPGMDCDGFDYLASEIAKKNFQTIIYDQRGTGKSTVESPNNQNITMDLMAEDIENLRKHLKIEKWTILGHSFGGIMATFYATKHPETIEKIIFSSSGGVNLKFMNYVSNRIRSNLTEEERDSLGFYQRKREAGDISENTNEKRAYFLSKAYVYDKSKSDSVSQRMTKTNQMINTLVLQNLQRIRFDCTNSFADFKQPVLVLQGVNDIISTETAEEIATAFPNSKLVLMDHCAHYGWIDAKKLYFDSIYNFLNN